MKQVSKLNPFGRFCCTIGNLPTSYMESLTYEEQLMWFCRFLDEKVIPAVNENAEAIIELQNYLKNLDLQDYVDNKLDEMAESGELEEIISAYVNLKSILAYNTVADMKLADNLIEGSFVKTYGFHSLNDGGDAFYKIIKMTTDIVIDEMEYISISDINLCAKFIYSNTMTPECFGAYGDGTHDDRLSIQKALDYNNKLVLMKRNYLISDSIIFKGIDRSITGNANILCQSNNPALIINGSNLIVEIAQIISYNAIKIDTNITDSTWCQYILFKNIDIVANNICVELERNLTKWVNEIKFDNVRFKGEIGLNFVGTEDDNFSYGGFRFINCSNEVCNTAFIKGYTVNDISIFNLRNNEAWNKPLFDINSCNYFIISTSALVSPDFIKITKSDDLTTKGVIIGNVVNYGGGRVSSISKCYNGIFTQESDKYTVLDNTHDTFDYKSLVAENIVPNTYILRSVGGNKTYTITLPENYMRENSFYINNQSVYNTLVINYGSVTKTIPLNVNGTYKISFIIESIFVEELNGNLV